MPGIIEKEWRGFVTKVYGPDLKWTNPRQYDELRDTFFGGAFAVFFMEDASSGKRIDKEKLLSVFKEQEN